MTQDEIIELAMNSGLPSKEAAQYQLWWLEAFAKLVEERTVAKEREACAKVCEGIFYAPEPEGCGGDEYYYTKPYLDCAEAIRARGLE